MRIIDYKILHDQSISALAEAVAREISERGWQPLEGCYAVVMGANDTWGPYIDYSQVLVRYEQEP